jgi:hypothetical protein
MTTVAELDWRGADAFMVLGLPYSPELTDRDMRTACLRRMRAVHPDAGGDAEGAQAVQAAYEALRSGVRRGEQLAALMTDRDAPRTSVHEPGTGNVPDAARREELRRRVTASRVAQGLPPYITDAAVLDRIADLLVVTLGRSDRKRRAHPRPLSAADPRREHGHASARAVRVAAPDTPPVRRRAPRSAAGGIGDGGRTGICVDARALRMARMAGGTPPDSRRNGHLCRARCTGRSGCACTRRRRSDLARADHPARPRATLARLEWPRVIAREPGQRAWTEKPHATATDSCTRTAGHRVSSTTPIDLDTSFRRFKDDMELIDAAHQRFVEITGEIESYTDSV